MAQILQVGDEVGQQQVKFGHTGEIQRVLFPAPPTLLHGFMVSWHPPLLGVPLAGFQQQQTFTEHLPGTVMYKALLGQDFMNLQCSFV